MVNLSTRVSVAIIGGLECRRKDREGSCLRTMTKMCW